MKAILVALAFVCFALAAHAQPVPSAYVPLAPCRVLDTRLSPAAIPAGATLHLTVRGLCNVPAEANSVTFTVAAWRPQGSGNLIVWEENLPVPAATTLNFSPAAVFSAGGTSRLCYPALECPYDLQLRPSQTTDLILDVTGYTVPL